MFSTFLKELGGYFDRHWLMAVFFPSLAFWSACLLVVGLVKGLSTTLGWWQTQTALMQAILLATGLSWVAFFGFLLGNFQTAIIRFYEGYWRTFPLSLLRRARLRYYRRRFHYLKTRTESLTQANEMLSRAVESGTHEEKQEALEHATELRALERERFLFFPTDEDMVMPTRLGNIIRAAELYPLTRYGIDAVVMWPRLHAVLPKEFIDQLLGAKMAMTFMLMISMLSFTFAMAACTALALYTPNWRLFLLCALGVPLSWLSYRNALNAGRLYAELIKTAFDLHRWKLLEALQIKPPASYEKETPVWEDVTYLVYRGEPPTSVTYLSEQPTPEQDRDTGQITLSKIASAIKNTFRSDNEQPARSVGQITAGDPLTAAHASQGKSDHVKPTSRPTDFMYFLSFILYLSIFGLIALLMSQRPTPLSGVLVAAKDLPAYHLFIPDDLQEGLRPTDEVTPSMLTDEQEIVGVYTLRAVARGEAITRDQLLKPSGAGLIENTLVVGIPVSRAVMLGGDLKPGDIVDITAVRATGVAQPATSARTFERILVLGVKTTAATQASEQRDAQEFVLIIALPAALKTSSRLRVQARSYKWRVGPDETTPEFEVGEPRRYAESLSNGENDEERERAATAQTKQGVINTNRKTTCRMVALA